MEDNSTLQEQVWQEGRASWARRLLAWSALAGYCGLIYYLSDQPKLRLLQALPSSATVAHIAVYAVLS